MISITNDKETVKIETKANSWGINEIAAVAALITGWIALIFVFIVPVIAFITGTITIFLATRGLVHSTRKTTALLGLLPALVAVFLSAGPTFLR